MSKKLFLCIISAKLEKNGVNTKVLMLFCIIAIEMLSLHINYL